MDDAPKLRVMMDANVLVAAQYSPRFPYEVLLHAVREDFKLVITDQIVEEARSAVRKLIPDKLATFDEQLAKAIPEIQSTPSKDDVDSNLDLVRDPKDVHVALAAIRAKIDFLITSDKDFTDPDQPIRSKINVLLPGAFLREQMGWTSERLEAIRTRKWAEIETE
jgi:putative PIN family toxin of toxin-antitoxin system